MSKLLLAAGMAIICGTAAWGKNNVPDFRLPETVIKNATKQIEKADKQGNHKELVDGLVRLSIAKSQISADYMPEIINYVDSFATKISDVRAKSLLLGLESDIVIATYRHESYKYDNRQKAGDVRPADPREWCREDYEDRILELTDSILSHRAELLATPVKDYDNILETPKVCPEFIPTLYDMLAHHSIAHINDIAGNDSDSNARQRVADIYACLLASHEEGSAPFIYSELQRVKTSGNISRYSAKEEAALKAHLFDIADKYNSSPYSVEIVDYLTDIDSSAKTVDLAHKAVVRHNNYPRINALRNFLKRIDQQILSISYSEAAKPDEEILIAVDKKNVDKITIRAYSVAGIHDIRMKKLKQMKPVTVWSTELNGDDKQTVRFPGLPTGRYILVPEFIDRNTHSAVVPNHTPAILTVSAIDIMMVNRINGDYFLLVVDAESSKPIEGATVTVRKDEDGNVVKSLLTDANGYALLNCLNDNGYYCFQAIVGNDCSRTISTWLNTPSTNDGRHLEASVFTDRGVYRPGETVDFAVAAYVSGVRFLETAKKKSLTVELQNTADKAIASQQLLTDEFGRVSGSFTLPVDGLTGTFHIVVRSGNKHVAWKGIEVSEYKAPTFFLEIDKEKSELSDLRHVLIKGKAMTFSQMPLAKTEVKVALSESFSWWWDDMDFSDYETTVITDNSGEFAICVPAECFSAAKGEIFVNAEVSATDNRGETQTASAILKMGKLASLPSLDDITANADKPVALSQDLKNFDNLTYEITDSASTVVKKDSLSPDCLTIDASGIASGEYTIKLSMPDGSGSTSFRLRLYRFTDAKPAFDTPMLIDKDTDIKCDADGSFALNWGNSKPHWFFYVIACDGNVTDYGWHHDEAGMHKFTGKAEFAPRGSSCLCLYWTDRHETKSAFIPLIPATPQDSIEIVTETFRDNITPGGKETWKLRIKNNNGKTFRSAVIANMYDAALNSIRENSYRFNPAYTTADEYWQNFSNPGNCYSSISSPLQTLDVATFVAPWLNYYGRQLGYDHFVFECCNTAPLRCYATAAPMADATLTESAVTEKLEAEAEPTESDGQQSATLRDEGIKTAFFLPGLVTNEQGEVTFTFDVPNRNTQWQFSAVAYTDDLHAHYINRIVSAAKQLMVQPNLPRFVREGDSLTISAAAQNNTETEQTVEVTIDINGQKHVFSGIVLQPKASKTVTTVYNVPATNGITVTTSVAADGRTTDGQRDRIAVLPATTDVVEASPFYITADKSRADIALPHFNRDGRLTLEYADNPAWYAASALPSMQLTAETATAHIVNYYVASVASHIVTDNPEIADAIAAWQKSPLKSRLEQNADLKTIALDNTPWSRRAETETDMMAHLADIADPATIQYRLQRALTALKDLQCPDGGFEWFRGCRSSIWTTEEVLNLFGYLNEMGYYPDDDAIAQQIVKRAVEYCDNHYDKMSKREDATHKSVIASASDYIFIRSMLPVEAPADSIKWIADGVVTMAASEWGDYSISGKAKAAILLANSKRSDAARDIVESLRQSARKSGDRGTYWDIDGTDKVALASTALKAISKVNPDDPMIDDVRHWLLLAKETQCWGSASKACDAINALLATGKNWTAATRKAPKIKGGNSPIETDDATPYFGYIRRSIDMKRNDGNICIRREKGCPAWGAVYCQYNAPMDSVASHSNADIRIEKQFYIYDKANTLRPDATTEFAVGDRIQVRLTIRSERDLDFVTLTDNRGACFEPADQLSVYEWQDGTGSYRETRDSATNIFFSHISKGTYVITYDVYANNAGTYASGIASLQCQYSPALTSHSAGATLTVE